MFFQPKYYRGIKSPLRSRGSYREAASSTENQTFSETAYDHTAKGRPTSDTSSIDLAGDWSWGHQRGKMVIEHQVSGSLDPHDPPRPKDHASSLLSSGAMSSSPVYHPYNTIIHAATPSLSPSHSMSSSSGRSTTSDSLLTPIRSHLHHIPPPAVPMTTVPPVQISRPNIPKPRARQPPSANNVLPRPRRSPDRLTPPPPSRKSLYSTMPLPPLPTTPIPDIPAFLLSAPPPISRTAPLRPAKSKKRDSQATVRPSTTQSQFRHRDTVRLLYPLPPAILEQHLQVCVEPHPFAVVDVDELEMADLSLLDVFPIPPSRDPSPSPSRQPRSIRRWESDAVSKRLSSKSTIKASRRGLPPPLPSLDFDIFCGVDGLDEETARLRSSESDRIREQYLASDRT